METFCSDRMSLIEIGHIERDTAVSHLYRHNLITHSHELLSLTVPS